MAYHCFYTTKKPVKQGSKNISIKMLKDVGMTVPKSRETSVVYICSNTGNEGTIFICSKTEDEGSIYLRTRNVASQWQKLGYGTKIQTLKTITT